jgi:hypothetical protein
MAFTIETALMQLASCRDDFKILVRNRIAEANRMVEEAKRMADIISTADVDAMTFLSSMMEEKDVSEDLLARIKQELALHVKIKEDHIVEASSVSAISAIEVA